MKPQARGFWGTSHWIFDAVGRAAFRFLPARSHPKDDAVYSIVGGALLGSLSGALIGTSVFDASRLSAEVGAILGVLLGVCAGIYWGAAIQSTDDLIRDVINSYDAK